MRQLWSEAENELLRKVYADKDNKSLSAIFNRSAGAIAKRAELMGLSKSQEYLMKQRAEAQAIMLEAWVGRSQKATKALEAKGKRIATGVVEINGNVRTHRMV
jgi:hypothetical protein